MKRRVRLVAAVLLAPLAWGASPPEAQRLGADLTPLGGEKAGNADGSIPAWSGGLRSAAEAGFPAHKSGAHYSDPYASDRPLFTITSANLAQYASRLSAGHKALFSAYPDYRMQIYPTHRSAAVPEPIARATIRLATSATLAPDGNGVTGAVGGIPFPLPKSGLEVLWNHLLRYRGAAVAREVGQAALAARGTYTVVNLKEELLFPYYAPGMTEGALGNLLFYLLQVSSAPATLAGEALLTQVTLDEDREAPRTWFYRPQQRRVLRAARVAFDNPATTPDDLRSADQFDMYNGSPQHYDWKLLGKQEMYVPYNAYALQSEKIRYWDLLHRGHINQDYARYELHRVWVVDATLKAGANDLYPRRTLYLDEDSWQILVVDCYGPRGELYRVQEGHVINYYDVPTIWTDLELVMDLADGRYLALGLQSQQPRSYDFSLKRSAADFQPYVLEQRGVR